MIWYPFNPDKVQLSSIWQGWELSLSTFIFSTYFLLIGLRIKIHSLDDTELSLYLYIGHGFVIKRYRSFYRWSHLLLLFVNTSIPTPCPLCYYQICSKSWRTKKQLYSSWMLISRWMHPTHPILMIVSKTTAARMNRHHWVIHDSPKPRMQF